jgi:hypothetical protein
MNAEGEEQNLAQAPSGGEPEKMMSRKPGFVPVTLVVVGLITVLGSYIVLNHLVANAWDSDPLHWEIATDIVLIGALLIIVGLFAGALDKDVDPLVRLGMILGAAIVMSLLIYEALVLFSAFQLG